MAPCYGSPRTLICCSHHNMYQKTISSTVVWCTCLRLLLWLLSVIYSLLNHQSFPLSWIILHQCGNPHLILCPATIWCLVSIPTPLWPLQFTTLSKSSLVLALLMPHSLVKVTCLPATLCCGKFCLHLTEPQHYSVELFFPLPVTLPSLSSQDATLLFFLPTFVEESQCTRVRQIARGDRKPPQTCSSIIISALECMRLVSPITIS